MPKLFYDPQDHVTSASSTTHTSSSGSVVKRSLSSAKLTNRRGVKVGVAHVVAEHFVNSDGSMSSDAKTTLILPAWTATLHHSYNDATASNLHTKTNYTAVASSTSGAMLNKKLTVDHLSSGKGLKGNSYNVYHRFMDNI
jgi:hypothetical protein